MREFFMICGLMALILCAARGCEDKKLEECKGFDAPVVVLWEEIDGQKKVVITPLEE